MRNCKENLFISCESACMMTIFALFGHSFVKRLKQRRGSVYEIELQRSTVPIRCFGEGGLSLDRIWKKPGKYLNQLRTAQPDVLIIDLGTNDLCSERLSPKEVHASLCELITEFPRWNIEPEAIVFLPVLPRTGSLRKGQVSLAEFNDRADNFNRLLECSCFLEDKWWVWQHRGLRSPRYILDGVHLNQHGMAQYERTLRQVVKYFECRIW